MCVIYKIMYKYPSTVKNIRVLFQITPNYVTDYIIYIQRER